VRRKVDIVVHAWGSIYALDVAVVDPAAPTYLHLGSDLQPDVTAYHRRKQKIAYWREMRGVRGVRFVPFGMAGASCLPFLRMNAAITRWNARMVLTCEGEIELPMEHGAQGGVVIWIIATAICHVLDG